MYVAKADINNFRNLQDFSITFQPGLNVIVGENNTGKTNVLDALRLVLSAGSTPRDIWAKAADLRHDENGVRQATSFEIHLTFLGLKGGDFGLLSKCLAPSISKDAAQIHFRFELRVDATLWGGETEGDTVESEVMDSLRATFLPALRDAEADLRPGRNTRISRLLDEISKGKPSEREALVQEIKTANKNIKDLPLMNRAKQAINDNLQQITGPALAQKADLALSPPAFERITDTIRALVGTPQPFEMSENGLGYNNLLYIGTVLTELQRALEIDLRLLLIEEPEAHLHPQLQVLLVDHLLEQAKQEVQVFVTSHSPTLASRVPVERIIVLHRGRTGKSQGKIVAKSIGECGLDNTERRDLRRYLDITKSTLFFSRGVILVEGISEALLLPCIARNMSIGLADGKTVQLKLEDHGVSIVNVSGLAFRPFAKLFQSGNLDIPCALISDGDPQLSPEEKGSKMTEDERDHILFPSQGESARKSPTAKAMQDMRSGQLDVFLGNKTFEYDLCLAGNSQKMTEVYKQMHPIQGKQMLSLMGTCKTERDRARAFCQCFDGKEKARFAQRLVEDSDTSQYAVVIPPYLVRAFKHVIGQSDAQSQSES
jgi:putative ATP-dependent endonuclease of OLD family